MKTRSLLDLLFFCGARNETLTCRSRLGVYRGAGNFPTTPWWLHSTFQTFLYLRHQKPYIFATIFEPETLVIIIYIHQKMPGVFLYYLLVQYYYCLSRGRSWVQTPILRASSQLRPKLFISLLISGKVWIACELLTPPKQTYCIHTAPVSLEK